MTREPAAPDHPDVVILRVAKELEHAGWWTLAKQLPRMIAELQAAARETCRLRLFADETVRNARQDEQAKMRREATIHDIVQIASAKRALTRHWPDRRDPWGPPFGGDAA